MRWIWRRWAWAVMTGVLVVATAAADNSGKSGPTSKSAPGSGATDGSRPSDTMVLKFPGEPERKVKVLKTSRQPDGSVATEVKDVATGETFTLMDGPADGKPGKLPPSEFPPPPQKPGSKSGDKPAAKPTDKTMPASAKEPADRKGLFGGRSNPSATEKPSEFPPPPAKGMTAPPPDTSTGTGTGRKPGLFSRIFGGKKSNPPMPNATQAMPGPGSSSNSMPPPPIRPGPEFMPPQPGRASSPSFIPPMTNEPPRTMPPRPVRAEPVVPPSPLVPPPSGLPPIPPVHSTPVPLPGGPGAAPSIPTPLPGPGAVPSIPAPLPSPMPTTPAVPVPTIPAPPGGTAQVIAPHDGSPIQVVLPAGYVPAEIAMHRDIQQYVASLSQSLMPSQRMLAARALADGRHGSTDHVKAVLFQTMQTDPCPAVKACCIEQLCKLGYYNPAFLEHLRTSWNDADEDVRRAARVALYKMTPRQQ